MNGLVIVFIAIVVLGDGYLLYGRWLASKWGLDPKNKPPISSHNNTDTQPNTDARIGPVTGPAHAMEEN